MIDGSKFSTWKDFAYFVLDGQQEAKEERKGFHDRLRSIEERLTKIETKIITSAVIIGSVLGLIQISINLVFK
jgi:hypothetical protein